MAYTGTNSHYGCLQFFLPIPLVEVPHHQNLHHYSPQTPHHDLNDMTRQTKHKQNTMMHTVHLYGMDLHQSVMRRDLLNCV